MRQPWRFSLVAAPALVLGLVASNPNATYAIPFDNSTGGPAVATVGSGGDYASLEAAAAAFSAVSGGINRPWTMQILNDLSEPNLIGIANTFGVDGSLTIKPAPSTTPKITFTSTATPTGFFGHLVIGSTGIAVAPSAANTPPSSGKYVIDGSNTVGGTTRDLTLAVGETAALASAVNRILRIVGDTDGVVVKNCNFIFNDTAGSYAAIGLGGGIIDSVNSTPDNVVIQNNSIISGQLTGSGANGFAIETTVAANGTIPSGAAAIQGLTVIDNDMVVKQRGVFMNGVGSATISRNKITVANTATTTATNAIFHFNSNGVSGWTQTYDRNAINTSSATNATGGNGAYGILVDSGPVGGTYNITNNTVTGPFLTNATAIDALARGINAASVTSTYTIEHNSVNLPANAGNGVTASRQAAIIFPLALTTGTAVIRNNIVRMGEVDGDSAAINLASATGITAEGNNLFADAGGRVGRVGTTNHPALSDWQTAGFDAPATGSQSVDPAAVSPAWDADLLFAHIPAGIGNVAASTTLVDIAGNPRPATGAFPGAQQPPSPPSSVADWSLLND
jgi:hypothetical protein